MNALHLDGRACLVTGGAQGIGYAVARALSGAGGRVCVADLNFDRAEAAAKRIATATGQQTLAVAMDVGQSDSVDTAFDRVRALFGDPLVLVNAAGIMTPQLALAHEVAPDDFDRMLDVHVRGAFLCSRAALPGMRCRKDGRIVNISSVLGILGLPYRVAYATAKTAIIGMTRALAVEGGRHGITVNAVAPGYILTETLRARLEAGMLDYDTYAERAPVGRWGLAEEVAHAIVFLAAPGSGFITGALLPVDGGYTVRGDPGESIGDVCDDALSSVRRLFGG